MIDTLCQRYGCLPSQLMKEDAGLLRMVKLVAMGRRDTPYADGLVPEAEDDGDEMEEMLSSQSKVME